MIIVSSGLPKSASTLLFLYTEELLQRSGKRSAQRTFRKFYPEGFIAHFGITNTFFLLLLNFFKGSVVVKTHSGPDFMLRLLLRLGVARATYSIRDPRDILLSALDHGKKARTNGIRTPADKAFVGFHSREEMYGPLQLHFQRFLHWKKFGRVLFVRYENLLTTPEEELKKILRWFGWSQQEKLVPEVVENFNRNKPATKNFNKGVLTRFETEYTPEELKETETKIGAIITELNYPLTR